MRGRVQERGREVEWENERREDENERGRVCKRM